MKLRFAVIAALVALASCRHQVDLPKLFPVPDATLVADSGKPVHLGQMKGYVTVYDFIFTSCAGTCPIMSHNMQQLTKAIDRDAPVRFVSISVDPTRDTPEVLRAYASHFRKDDRWIFVTGKREDIVRLSVEGFKLAVGGSPQPGAEPLLHSAKFAIADKSGMIRDYASAIDGDSVDRVAGVVKQLVRE